LKPCLQAYTLLPLKIINLGGLLHAVLVMAKLR
jgi:hypothetical protein